MSAIVREVSCGLLFSVLAIGLVYAVNDARYAAPEARPSRPPSNKGLLKKALIVIGATLGVLALLAVAVLALYELSYYFGRVLLLGTLIIVVIGDQGTNPGA